jgi:hypothetical protein
MPFVTILQNMMGTVDRKKSITIEISTTSFPMGTIKFELRGEGFDVQRVIASQVCSVLARNPGTLPCVVRSAVSLKVFRLFLSAIAGNAVEVTDENVDDLWALCVEFEFWSLLGRVRAFKETPIYQIRRQNARIEALEKRFDEFMQRSQMRESSLEAAVARLPRVEGELEMQSQAQESIAAFLTDALALKGKIERLSADVGSLQHWRQSAEKAQDRLARTIKSITADVQNIRDGQKDGLWQRLLGMVTILSTIRIILGKFFNAFRTTRTDHSPMTNRVELVHPCETLKVPIRTLVLKCNLFADDLTLASAPDPVRSAVSVDDLRLFISTLDDKEYVVTNANFGGLSLLCDEFGCISLSQRLSAFSSLRISSQWQ